ncbi:hypothetical protein EI94DRAFT_1739130 [Lactarius quietus]|nr:hypothetical protein EI94DRAFT_1739130 [Lactarius quietus]
MKRSLLLSLLESLLSSTTLTLPTAAMYDRIRDYICRTSSPGFHHLKVRTIDGTANPDIAVISGQKGLKLKIEAIDGGIIGAFGRPLAQ